MNITNIIATDDPEKELQAAQALIKKISNNEIDGLTKDDITYIHAVLAMRCDILKERIKKGVEA